jgi:hypothetical protein
MIKHIIAFKGENNSVTLSFINKFNKINNEAMKKNRTWLILSTGYNWYKDFLPDQAVNQPIREIPWASISFQFIKRGSLLPHHRISSMQTIF